MILTKSSPFTLDEIEKLQEEYTFYIKTVIDLQKKICSAGANMHYENEKILLDQGSRQEDLWGGGIEIDDKTILFNSFINIRPAQGNTSNEIQDQKIRDEFEEHMKYFFKELYDK